MAADEHACQQPPASSDSGPERVLEVEDGLDSVGPERVLEVAGGVVTCYLEGLVAATLRRMRAGEPERVGDAQVPAPRAPAGSRRVRSTCRGGSSLGNEQ